MTIIFCFKTIFRNSHREIFGLDKLIKEGYKVKLLDLGGMYGGIPTCSDELMLSLRTRIMNESDLQNFRNSLNQEPVIYIINDTYLMPTHSAFPILLREQDRLLAYKIKPTPFQYEPEKGIKLVLQKTMQNLNFLPFHLYKPVYSATHNYYIPHYYMCNTNFNLPLKVPLIVKRENILITHSDDVNKIIADKSEVQKEERIGVFLDQVLPYAYKRWKPYSVFDNYYKDLTLTLEGFKKKFRLDKIVIAEHPESVALVEELKDKYVGFERARGKTQNLIKNATYVFAHYSTSIGIAVYYEKPIILLLSDDLKKVPHIPNAVGAYKEQLNLPIFDMGKREFPNPEQVKINKSLYKTYVKKFMKDSKINENAYHYAIKKIQKDLNC